MPMHGQRRGIAGCFSTHLKPIAFWAAIVDAAVAAAVAFAAAVVHLGSRVLSLRVVE